VILESTLVGTVGVDDRKRANDADAEAVARKRPAEEDDGSTKRAADEPAILGIAPDGLRALVVLAVRNRDKIVPVDDIFSVAEKLVLDPRCMHGEHLVYKSSCAVLVARTALDVAFMADVKMRSERDAAVKGRDAAIEALAETKKMLRDAEQELASLGKFTTAASASFERVLAERNSIARELAGLQRLRAETGSDRLDTAIDGLNARLRSLAAAPK
jgi:hypothetical protein